MVVAVARIVSWPRGRPLASPAWFVVDMRVIPLGTVPACARGRSTTAVGGDAACSGGAGLLRHDAGESTGLVSGLAHGVGAGDRAVSAVMGVPSRQPVAAPGRLRIRGGTDRWAVHGRTVLKRAVAGVGFASNRTRRRRRGDPCLLLSAAQCRYQRLHRVGEIGSLSRRSIRSAGSARLCLSQGTCCRTP